jgi:hypothetical protein
MEIINKINSRHSSDITTNLDIVYNKIRHSRVSGNPESSWIPAFAGMTKSWTFLHSTLLE